MQQKHIDYYISQCLNLSKLSICPRNKFGCVIVEPITNTIRSTGYNNPPRNHTGLCGGNCCLREKNQIKSGTSCEIGCFHAEQNAILLSARNGISLNGCWAFVNGEPCLMCAKSLYHAGIVKIFILGGKYSSDGVDFLKQFNIEVVYYCNTSNLEPDFE